MEDSLQSNSSQPLKSSAVQVSPPSNKVSKLVFGVVILLTALIAGTTGYFVGQQKTSRTTLSPSAQPTPQPSPESSTSSDISGSNVSIESSSRSGWVKYTNNSFGFSFEYPLTQLELREEKQADSGEVVEISLFTKQTKNLDAEPIKLLSLSTIYSPHTYNDPNVPESIDKDAYTIQGKKYDAWNFIMGEGGPCGGGGVNTALVKLKEKLIVYKFEFFSSRNKDKENCESKEFDEFRTPKKDLDLADTIIETIELVK